VNIITGTRVRLPGVPILARMAGHDLIPNGNTHREAAEIAQLLEAAGADAFNVTGGSQLVNVPSNQRAGWTFAGTTANEIHRPSGYDHQVDGQVFLNEPVPAKASSWGAVKARYRQ